MLSTEPAYHRLLSAEFKRRKKKNSSYSLRAYSRFLEMHPSTLSHVMQLKRNLAFKDAFKISEKLNLDPDSKKEFFSSLAALEVPQGDTKKHLFEITPALDAEIAYNVIAEWEHYALLYLMQTADFCSERAWIAERLGITTARVDRVLENLFDLNLAEASSKGELRPTRLHVCTSDGIQTEALEISHKECLQTASRSFEEVPYDLRDCTSLTFSVNPENIAAIKKEIRFFYNRIEKYVKKKNRTEVYELCVALYPRTKVRHPTKKSDV